MSKEKLSEKDLAEIQIWNGIIEYCEVTGNYSYYDLKAYAAQNHPDWFAYMQSRDNARAISYFLKDLKKQKGTKYKDPYHVAYANYVEAAADRIK